MQPNRVIALSLLASSLLLGGCATYLDAKSATAAGGRQDQQKATARADLAAAKSENVTLGDAKLQRERELKRLDDRLRAVNADLRKQDQALAAAQKSRKVSAARHSELKRELEAIRAEAESVDLQNKGDAFKSADAQADKAKEQRLRDLEKRRKDLETALAQLAGG